MGEHPERRRYARVRSGVPLVASVVGEQNITHMSGEAELICEGGVTASLPGPLAPGDVVFLELHIPNSSNQAVCMNAIVRHCSSGRQGLEFISLGEQTRQALRRYCKSRPAAKPLRTTRARMWKGKTKCSFCGKAMMYIGSGAYICRICRHWEYTNGNGNGAYSNDGTSPRPCDCIHCRARQPG